MKEDLEKIYLEAKDAYYSGNPIMTDEEFDELELKLENLGSDVINIVGTTDRSLKFAHLSPMLSLSKAQASLNGIPPDITNWFKKFPNEKLFEATPKYDGNAVNLIYKNGELSIAITRGNKFLGRDVTNKLKHIIPNKISHSSTVEIRGEVVIPVTIFDEKYSNAKNPRNFVAGILNRDEINPEIIKDLDFVAVEVRFHSESEYTYPPNTNKWFEEQGFNLKNLSYTYFNQETFQEIYRKYEQYRMHVSPYQLDGFVIKTLETNRKKYGETEHHPNWAIAIKFPPQKATAIVEGLTWDIGTTGNITPIVNFKPVKLDGSVISNASGYNLGFLLKMKVYPGSEVIIAKAGDIIPQIRSIVKEGDESKFSYPVICPACGTETKVDGVHLFCPNNDCSGKIFKKVLSGIRSLGIMKFGTATVKSIYDSGYTSVLDIFDQEKFTKENLISTGNFKDGKALDNLFIELYKIKSLPYYKVILSLGFDGIGETAAKQLAKKLNNQEYTFFGLEREALLGFEIGEWKYELIQKFISILNKRNISIEIEHIINGSIGCEFTGSPKEAGFKTKSDLLDFISKYGYVHESLKTAKLLLTDSLDSTSSKMETARKNGIEIMTYEKFVNSKM